MIAEQRRQQILKLIEEQGSIRISNLGQRFNVTDMTIRRDIDRLSELGLLRQTVEQEFQVKDEREKKALAAGARLEADIVRKFMDLGKRERY